MRFFALSIFILIALFIYSFFFFESISFQNLRGLLTLISASSGVIFTILGLWIAYVYPNAIIKIAKPSIDEIFSASDLKTIEHLILSLSLSLLIIASVIVFWIIVTTVKDTQLFVSHRSLIKPIGIGIVLTLCYAQLVIFYFVLATNINFLNSLHTKSSRAKAKSRLDT